MKQFIDFAEKYNITMDVEDLGFGVEIEYHDGKKHEWPHYKYNCVLTHNFDHLTIPYRQGTGIEHEPEIDDVLYSIQGDAWIARNARDFENFCSEFGYSPDSIKALNIYKGCKKTDRQLRKFFGNLYKEFMELGEE